MACHGFKHVYTVLLAVDAKAMVSSRLPKKCLALLLKLFHFFFVAPERYHAYQTVKEVVDADVSYERLV